MPIKKIKISKVSKVTGSTNINNSIDQNDANQNDNDKFDLNDSKQNNMNISRSKSKSINRSKSKSYKSSNNYDFPDNFDHNIIEDDGNIDMMLYTGVFFNKFKLLNQEIMNRMLDLIKDDLLRFSDIPDEIIDRISSYYLTLDIKKRKPLEPKLRCLAKTKKSNQCGGRRKKDDVLCQIHYNMSQKDELSLISDTKDTKTSDIKKKIINKVNNDINEISCTKSNDTSFDDEITRNKSSDSDVLSEDFHFTLLTKNKKEMAYCILSNELYKIINKPLELKIRKELKKDKSEINVDQYNINEIDIQLVGHILKNNKIEWTKC